MLNKSKTCYHVATYLKTVTALCFFSDNIEYRIDEFGAFCVMSLGPVVPCSALAKDEVVWSEDLAKGTWSDRVHGAWLEIDEHGSWNVLAAGGLIVVDVDTLELEIRVAMVGTGRVDAVFVGDHLPELWRERVSKLVYKYQELFRYGPIILSVIGLIFFSSFWLVLMTKCLSIFGLCR